ncbi:hypothetical protein CIB48_g11824 [Xylaria polymorpha]|nr:hypothetical protein CIB48_g11824 [Xylaria polymorpha]
MSHLTEFSLVLAYVKRRLGGGEESVCEYRHHGQFGGEPFTFPLPGIPSPDQVAEFYTRLNIEVESSPLHPERKKHIGDSHLRHTTRTVLSRKTSQNQEQSKEYDDRHPVHWSEVYRPASSQHTTPPEYWLLFKLESLLPVLRLSVRILRLVLPDCKMTWDEWEYSLCRKEWLQQFILDSRVSSWKSTPLHAPRRVDVVGLNTLDGL